jgi:hypothetical protein
MISILLSSIVWIGGLALLLQMLFSAFLIPLLIELFLPINKKLSQVIDDYSKEWLAFVRIKVRNSMTKSIFSKAVTDYSGKFFMSLKASKYDIELIKNTYEPKNQVMFSGTEIIANTFELPKMEEKEFGSHIQLRALKIKPILILCFFSTLFAIINILDSVNIYSITILVLSILSTATVFLGRKKPSILN